MRCGCQETGCRLCYAEIHKPDLIAQVGFEFVAHKLRPDRFPFPMSTRIRNEPFVSEGVGVEFKRLMARCGIVEKGCACPRTAAKMNQGGPQWCRENIASLVEEILCNAKQAGLVMSVARIALVAVKDDVARRILKAAVGLSPIASAIKEAVIIACEAAEAPKPEPTPPQPEVDELPSSPPEVVPYRRWRIEPGRLAASEYHFNSSIVEWQGRTLLAYRRHWYQAEIWIAELGTDGQPIRDVEVDVPRNSPNAIAVEDPRFFIHDESLWLEVIGVACNQKTKKAHTNIQLVRLDSETLQPVESYFPDYQPRREWEKNWGMFEYE